MRCNFHNCRHEATHTADSGFGHGGGESGVVCESHAYELVDVQGVPSDDVNPISTRTPSNGSEGE